MKKLSIVYHTQSKSTEKLANYIYEGCLKENSVETHMQLAAEADSPRRRRYRTAGSEVYRWALLPGACPAAGEWPDRRAVP